MSDSIVADDVVGAGFVELHGHEPLVAGEHLQRELLAERVLLAHREAVLDVVGAGMERVLGAGLQDRGEAVEAVPEGADVHVGVGRDEPPFVSVARSANAVTLSR